MLTGNRAAALALIGFLVLMCGCQSAYYGFWEKLGKEKRHLLKDHIQDAQSEQAKASEEFKDALTRIKEMYGFQGGDLEKVYDRLHANYERCDKRAKAVSERIDSVEQIAEDLFREWEEEIDQMSNENFRSKSLKSMKESKRRYARLHKAMSYAEARMEPVLRHLRDYVLFLKHNLNARAVGALKKEVGGIESEVAALIRDMDKSIREADDFLKTLE